MKRLQDSCINLTNSSSTISIALMDGYQKLRLLGEGAYGRVFLAREKRPPRRLVCIKQLIAAVAPGTLENEIRLMQRARHPNVVRFLDACFATISQRWIAMEFCSGGDLRAFLRQRPPPKIHEDRVWYWIVQLSLALSYLHESSSCKGIWHRDVKTSNIFVNNAGFLVLGDLGVARESSTDLASTVIGTPLYMAPEIWDGKQYDGACDLWALGCVIYEVCTGRTPFEDAKSTPALIKRACDGKYTSLSATKWSARLRNLVDELLSIDPTKRPTAASILRQSENEIHLQRYVQDRVVAAARVNGASTQEEEEQTILLHQLNAIGIKLEPFESDKKLPRMPVDFKNQSSAVVTNAKSERFRDIELEQRLRLQREHERHEQLQMAIRRMQELRKQQVEDVNEKPNFKDDTIAKGIAKPPLATVGAVDPEWKAPIQVDSQGVKARPSSASPGSGKRRAIPAIFGGPIEFSGIPRVGAPLTKQAKSYASKTQSPLCRDVRLLRKQESTKTAARYRAGLDQKYNIKHLPRRTSDSGDEMADCIAQLELVLLAQLKTEQ